MRRVGSFLIRNTLAIALKLFIVISCLSGYSSASSAEQLWPTAEFAVISDLHVFDPELGTSGEALQRYLAGDRKMVIESLEITDSAINAIAKSDVKFVLVTGDLTKDGELSSHKLVAKSLTRLEEAGKKVYVIPGNHDIDNPSAVRYAGDKSYPTPSCSSKQFTDIYSRYGYSDAIDRDSASLSYVAEPIPGLWVLAIDSTSGIVGDGESAPEWQRWPHGMQDNLSHEIVANNDSYDVAGNGRLKPRTAAWISHILRQAQSNGTRVIAMVHHGVVEHFKWQSMVFSRWLITGNNEVARLLAEGNVPVVFSGHFHAQDAVSQTIFTLSGRKRLTDIETGSLATFPCPYRLVSINSQGEMYVKSYTVKSTSRIPDEDAWSLHIRDSLSNSVTGLARQYLSKTRLSTKDVELLTPSLAQAFASHLVGDESKRIVADTSRVSLYGKLIGKAMSMTLLRGLSVDVNTPDNELTINLLESR